MPKLNKTETYTLALTNLADIIDNTDLVAKTKKQDLMDLLSEAMIFLAPSVATSTKINEDGDVWCNYFKQYLPAIDFDTKVNSKKLAKLQAAGTEYLAATEQATGYKANSMAADKIIRKTKSLRKKLEQQAMTEFRFKRLTDIELNQLLDIAESFTTDSYNDLESIPSIWDKIQPEMGEANADMMAEAMGEAAAPVSPVRPTNA